MDDDPTIMRRRTFLALLSAAGASAAVYPMLDDPSVKDVSDFTEELSVGQDVFLRRSGDWLPVGAIISASLHQDMEYVTTLVDSYRQFKPLLSSELYISLAMPDFGLFRDSFDACMGCDLMVRYGGYSLVFDNSIIRELNYCWSTGYPHIDADVRVMLSGPATISLV